MQTIGFYMMRKYPSMLQDEINGIHDLLENDSENEIKEKQFRTIKAHNDSFDKKMMVSISMLCLVNIVRTTIPMAVQLLTRKRAPWNNTTECLTVVAEFTLCITAMPYPFIF